MAVEHLIDVLAWNNFLLAVLHTLNLLQRIWLLHGRCVAKVEGTAVASVEESIVEKATVEVAIGTHDSSVRITVLSEETWLERTAVLIGEEIDAVEIGARRFGLCDCRRGFVVRFGHLFGTRDGVAWVAAGHIEFFTEGNLTFRVAMTDISVRDCILLARRIVPGLW